MNHYCVSFTGLQEIAVQENPAMGRPFTSYDDLIQEALRKSKITTPRKNPQAIECIVYRLEIEGLELVRRQIRKLMVTPPMTAMNKEEFEVEMSEILEDVPAPLKSFVREKSWEEGHSSGYDEVICQAINLADELRASALKAN